MGRRTGPKPTGVYSARKVRSDELLDRNEIQMVPSKRTEAGERSSSLANETKPNVADPMSIQKKRSVRAVDRESVLAERPPGENMLKQDRLPEPSRISTHRKGSITDHVGEPAIEETVLVNAEESDTGKKIALGSEQDDQDPKAGKERSKKVFFEMTSKIIEGRPAEPDEVRNIVLREVQEWVGAEPDEVALDVEVQLGDEERLHTEQPRPLRVIAQETNAAKLVAERQPDQIINGETERQAVEENFELSIGTISVTIEGSERPQEKNESPPHREQVQNAGTHRPAYSRLDRSYL
jgi:hypothetical protein